MSRTPKDYTKLTTITRSPLYLDLLVGVAVHELAHQLDNTPGHYSDSNGNGKKFELAAGYGDADDPGDSGAVQFDYPDAKSGAPGYRSEDYWMTKLKFGQGVLDGFLRNVNLSWQGMVDRPPTDAVQLDALLQKLYGSAKLNGGKVGH